MTCGTLEETLEHAAFLARHFQKSDLQYVTIAVLLELGIPTKRLGFDYLKEAIAVYCTEPGQMITKSIYPAVGQMYASTPDTLQVEQTIRTAINDAWDNRDEQVWRLYFRTDRNGRVIRPSNMEFISGIGYFLELWKGCCKEVNYEKG